MLFYERTVQTQLLHWSFPQELKDGELLLWLDWKQNVTLPLSHKSTGDEYWASSRMETSLLGGIAYVGRAAGPPRKVGLLWVSDVLDHTAVAAGLQMQEMMTRCLGPLSKFTRVSLWFDTGPHYRTVDLWSFLAQEWLLKENRLDLLLTISYFTEKHGKGEVDSLFSCCNQWLCNATRKPGTRLENVDQLIDALRAGAEQDMRQDPPPNGMKYVITKWDTVKKPPNLWKADAEIQVRKTYCIKLHLAGERRRVVFWNNHRFSDCSDGERFSVALSKPRVPAADRSWRRGYYGTDKWRKAFPETNTRNTMVTRLEALEPYSRLEVRDSTSLFEKRAARYLAKLAVGKARKTRRRRRVQAQREAVDASSSSSSSSSDSSSSSSDSSEEE